MRSKLDSDSSHSNKHPGYYGGARERFDPELHLMTVVAAETSQSHNSVQIHITATSNHVVQCHNDPEYLPWLYKKGI